jgi:hypothetical protein
MHNSIGDNWENFGDVSIRHGQTWIKRGGDDWAACVTILSGSDIGLADNQFRIESGSIYFSPRNWDSALSACGTGIYGPPEYWQVACAFHAYQGMDLDRFELVQIGKTLDDWTASGTTWDDPDRVLHGNTSIKKYLHAEYLA